MSHTRPNILLIHSDQHRWDCLGVNGHPLLQTPHLDRLAASGVNFTHAFTPQPVCSPARACLLTGVWTSQHHCAGIPSVESYQPADPTLPTWPRLLKEAGYQLRYVGKSHNELAGEPTDWGFDEYVPESRYASWRESQELPPPKPDDSQGIQQWFGHTDEGVTPEQGRLAWGADHAIRMMQDGDAAGEPWVVRWDPSEPHLPCIVPEPYAAMYPIDAIEPWPSFPDACEGKPWIQKQQQKNWEIDGWSWEQFAPIVQRYLGEITLLDAQVGRVLDALDELGAAANTLVIYTTDHGDFCGGHGMMDKHYAMYDDLVRVPLIMRGPGIPVGSTCDAFVSHEIDLACTICEMASVTAPDTFEGKSLADLATGHDPEPRPDIFAQYQGAQFGLYTERMVRERRWKYVWNATDIDELYDLVADPGERRNLIHDPSSTDELVRLRGRLVAWMESVADPMLNMWTRGQLGGH